MFRCTVPPAETSFPTTLPGLNMAINTAGQPVDAATGAPFAFFHSRDARVNDIRKEAFNTAMRAEMKLKLGDFGIMEHYITAGNSLQATKPQGKHVPVLMTPVSKVQSARDVIVVVGESGQDCGVFAWRLVREDIKRGTAVGLAAAVKEKSGGEEEVPAMIILNPGQLFYSYRGEVAKTLVSWNDGPREDGVQEFPDKIDDEVNQLEGKSCLSLRHTGRFEPTDHIVVLCRTHHRRRARPQLHDDHSADAAGQERSRLHHHHRFVDSLPLLFIHTNHHTQATAHSTSSPTSTGLRGSE